MKITPKEVAELQRQAKLTCYNFRPETVDQLCDALTEAWAERDARLPLFAVCAYDRARWNSGAEEARVDELATLRAENTRLWENMHLGERHGIGRALAVVRSVQVSGKDLPTKEALEAVYSRIQGLCGCGFGDDQKPQGTK